MSYARMDHAEWAEANNKAARSMSRKPARPTSKGYWGAPEKLTEFQAKVIDICGMVGGGIYNAPITWESVDWGAGENGMTVPWGRNSLSTFDNMDLTRLVFLCHAARIRCSVGMNGLRGFRFGFWQRSHDGCGMTRHPNLTEAIASFEEYLPADHRVRYQPPATATDEVTA